jgi:hypothetical protein
VPTLPRPAKSLPSTPSLTASIFHRRAPSPSFPGPTARFPSAKPSPLRITPPDRRPSPSRFPRPEWWLYPDIALLEQEFGPFFVNGDNTTLDFASQTAFTGDTNPNGNEVGIYGLEANGWGSASIYLNGNNCLVRGLGPVHQRGYALYIAGNNNRVMGSTISGPLHAGVYITGGFGGPPATGNIIGGTGAGEGNTISGGSSGVRIDGPAEGNIVIGNGLLSGPAAGVEVRSAPSSNLFAVNNRIGGPTAAERNHIAGSGRYGQEGFPTGTQVALSAAIGTIVQGNYIGTNAAGTASYVQRGTSGVSVSSSPGTRILGNLISGILVVGTNHYLGQRFGTGISISGDTTGLVVRGNRIGTDASGQNAVPNRVGINISSQNPVIIGGLAAGQANTIAFHETFGVIVNSTARGAEISGNSIHSNGGLGIDLFSNTGAGVTLNEPCDGDDGGNGLQNFPVLDSAATGSGGTVITGSLNSASGAQYRIEFFSSAQCDSTGHGEGATFLGSTTVTTDSACAATFQVSVASVPVGAAVTATATHLATGNTSEFSSCQAVTQAGGTPPQLLSAVSRKEYTGGTAYDVDLMAASAPAVESRGRSGLGMLVFTFDRPVTTGSASVTGGAATVAGTTFSGSTMTVSLTGMADAQMLIVRLSGITDGSAAVMPDTPISLKVLTGDTNGDGTVNVADATQTRSRSGSTVDATNYRSDVNADGVINAADTFIVRSNSGAYVP